MIPDGLTLVSALEALRDCYRAIEIRSLIAYASLTPDEMFGEEWVNVCTVVRLTRRGQDDVIQEQSSLRNRLGVVDLKRLKLLMNTAPAGDIGTILESISLGYMKLGSFQVRLRRTKGEELRQQRLFGDQFAIKRGEYGEYPIGVCSTSTEGNMDSFLQNVGLDPSHLGLPATNDIMSSMLEIDGSHYSSDLFVVLPIYLKLLPFEYVPPKGIRIKAKTHKSLLGRVTINVLRKNQKEQLIERKSLKPEEYQSVEQEDIVYSDASISFGALDPADLVTAELYLSDIGVMDRRKESVSALAPGRPASLLADAFGLFEAWRNLPDFLTKPTGKKQSEEFEIAVGWLLELVGMQVIRPSSLEQSDRILDDHDVGSLDLLVIDPVPSPGRLFVVDCTIRPPNGKKVDNIQNTAQCVSRRLQRPVKPVVFVAVQAQACKTEFRDTSVKILDSDDISLMIESIRTGNVERVKGSLEG
jgi:hypothetical protein